MGRKIEEGETPKDAMGREMLEEIGQHYKNKHVITLTCPGGTVYVYKAICHTEKIVFEQIEDELLKTTPVDDLLLPYMHNLEWIIPLVLSTIQFPVMVHQKDLGII